VQKRLPCWSRFSGIDTACTSRIHDRQAPPRRTACWTLLGRHRCAEELDVRFHATIERHRDLPRPREHVGVFDRHLVPDDVGRHHCVVFDELHGASLWKSPARSKQQEVRCRRWAAKLWSGRRNRRSSPDEIPNRWRLARWTEIDRSGHSDRHNPRRMGEPFVGATANGCHSARSGDLRLHDEPFGVSGFECASGTGCCVEGVAAGKRMIGKLVRETAGSDGRLPIARDGRLIGSRTRRKANGHVITMRDFLRS
jgi:hypothetical protein